MMPDGAEIDRALDALQQHHAAFADALRAMYNRRYTGASTLHWQCGVPKILELPGTRIHLASAVSDDRS
jgi:hypothetical protein